VTLKELVKSRIWPSGRKQRRILGGIAAGVVMELDPQSDTQRLLGLYEREIAGLVFRLAGECATLVDIGANDGYYTNIFLRTSAKRIVVCEPSPVVSRLLVNAAANGFIPDQRFCVIQRLIRPGEDAIYASQLVQNLPGPVFLKVDIDGGELNLLQSCESSDRLEELHWLIETHSAWLENSCVQWFQQRRYRTKVIPNAWWRLFLPELRPIAHNRWLLAEPELPHRRCSVS